MTFELGVLLAFGAMACWAVGDFLIQRTIRKTSSAVTLAFIGIIGTFAMLPFVANEINLALIPGNLVFLALLGAIAFFAGFVNCEAYREGKLGVMTIVLQLSVPLTIILSMYFLRERPTLQQVGLIIAIFAGIALVAAQSLSPRKVFKDLEKGTLLGIVAAFMLAAVNFLTAVGSRSISPLLVVWAHVVVIAILGVTSLAVSRKIHLLAQCARESWPLIVSMGIIDAAAWVLYSFAVGRGKVSITVAIVGAYPALAMGLGVWLNRETIRLHQYAGAALALGCAISLALL